MERIYSDVKDSIPFIIGSGVLILNGDTQEQLYLDAKEKFRFGQTSDI